MKILGVEVKNPIGELTTIYKCPYCSKKLINKNSYYNHIKKKYCWNFHLDFVQKTNEYEQNKINKKEYYTWCYENGYIEFLNLDKITKEELEKDFFDKISSLYNDWPEDY